MPLQTFLPAASRLVEDSHGRTAGVEAGGHNVAHVFRGDEYVLTGDVHLHSKRQDSMLVSDIRDEKRRKEKGWDEIYGATV